MFSKLCLHILSQIMKKCIVFVDDQKTRSEKSLDHSGDISRRDPHSTPGPFVVVVRAAANGNGPCLFNILRSAPLNIHLHPPSTQHNNIFSSSSFLRLTSSSPSPPPHFITTSHGRLVIHLHRTISSTAQLCKHESIRRTYSGILDPYDFWDAIFASHPSSIFATTLPYSPTSFWPLAILIHFA